jgi:hypothetical protein
MNEFLDAAIAYRPEDSRNRIIRRAASYMKVSKPKERTRVYYDAPEYPGWRGGFIETNLKDFRGRTYGIVMQRVWTDKEQADALRAFRKLYRETKCMK